MFQRAGGWSYHCLLSLSVSYKLLIEALITRPLNHHLTVGTDLSTSVSSTRYFSTTNIFRHVSVKLNKFTRN